MRTLRSRTLLLAVSAGLVLAASPAFAWTCTAKNLRGATYVGVGVLKENAIERALAKCHAGSIINAGCVIIDCNP